MIKQKMKTIQKAKLTHLSFELIFNSAHVKVAILILFFVKKRETKSMKNVHSRTTHLSPLRVVRPYPKLQEP